EWCEIDPKKAAAVVEWPLPTNQRPLRGFLVLAGYYRCFIKGYATIAAPLSSLLQKQGFNWGELETKTFDDLKTRMSDALILGPPSFNEIFMVEADASAVGIDEPQRTHAVGYTNTPSTKVCAERIFNENEDVTAAFMAMSRPLVGLIGELRGLIIFHDQYYVGADSKLKDFLLSEFHDTPMAGHSGVKKMLVGLPFEVLEHVGKVAYRPALPDASKIHSVFHVSLHIPGTGQEVVTNLPEEEHERHRVEQPLAVCATRLVLTTMLLASQVFSEIKRKFSRRKHYKGMVV
ncbi:hypothetical protein Tco_1516332, partial [Tanacetum coccineum]